MATAKGSIQRQRRGSGLEELLPTSVQKSYFILSDAERDVLNSALEKYRPGQCEPILVGGANLLKPALQLMTSYRLVIEEIKDAEEITSYTRWVETVQVRGAENQEVYQSVSDIQSALREHLAGIEEASDGVCCPEAGQYRTPKPVCPAPVQLGTKKRQDRD